MSTKGKAPRSMKLLQLLKHNPRGMRLQELLDALDETGRSAQAATVTMLLNMRQKGRVAYEPAKVGSDKRGGTYIATPVGVDYLARKLDRYPEWAEELEEGVIETGAMHGERPTHLHRTANEFVMDLRAGLPNSVFSLAQSSWGVRGGQQASTLNRP